MLDMFANQIRPSGKPSDRISHGIAINSLNDSLFMTAISAKCHSFL